MSPAEIAAKLTKEQREALLFHDGKPGALFPQHLVDAGYELLEMKLFGAKPTPLGFAVRAELERQQ